MLSRPPGVPRPQTSGVGAANLRSSRIRTGPVRAVGSKQASEDDESRQCATLPRADQRSRVAGAGQGPRAVRPGPACPRPRVDGWTEDGGAGGRSAAASSGSGLARWLAGAVPGPATGPAGFGRCPRLPRYCAAMDRAVTAGAQPSLAEIEWGDMGTWVAGLATLLAVAVAIWIAVRDGRVRDAERRDAEAGQARLVSVSTPWGNAGGIQIHVTNHSEAPIVGLEIDDVGWVSGLPAGVKWRVAPAVFGARASCDVLPAGGVLKVPVEFADSSGAKHRVDTGEAQVDISFHDAAGRTWRRTSNSPPVRVIH